MAFSHHKLTIKEGPGQGSSAVVSYLADAQPTGDYYSEAEHAFMRWLATPIARSALGLQARVELWKVEALLRGQHPLSGNLIRRWGPNATIVGGQDCTLSPAPKSVSILWALANPEVRVELEILLGQATSGAMAAMLGELPLVRERYGPNNSSRYFAKAEDYVAVQALHTTARLTEAKPGVPDPDLHIHNVVFGAFDAEKGGLRAMESRQILNYGSRLDADAQAQLAEDLRLRGFEIERELIRDERGKVKRVAWEIKGVPRALIKAMSTRSQEIEALKQRYREHTGREAVGPGWEAFVTRQRGPKAKLSASQLRAAWVEEAAQHGYSPEAVEQALAEADARRETGIPERGVESQEAQQLKAEILADVCLEHALVPTAKLDALVYQRAIGLVSPYVADGVVSQMLTDGDLLLSKDRRFVTTLEVLAAEQRAIKAARELFEAPRGPAAYREQLEQEFQQAEDEGRPFDQAQKKAIEVALGGSRFVSITGPAGAGKGLASRSMVNLWHQQGRRVIALAVAGRTSQQTQVDAGADRQLTIDGLREQLKHKRLQLAASDVLLADEGALIGHERYVTLLEAAVTSGATLVQIGDDKQLSPVEAGGLWTVTHAMAEERGQAVELQTIRRARNPAEGQAWTEIRQGEVEEGLGWYREQRQLHLYETRAELLHGIAQEWWQRDRSSVMVIDTTNAERDSINRIAQAKRLEAGELGPIPLELANGQQVRAGDRVLFHRIHEPEEELNGTVRRVENGTPATVIEVGYQTGSGETVEAGHAPDAALLELKEPSGEMRQLVVKASAPLELGYARHIYKAQGMSIEVANVATGPLTSRERLYTMVSRSREGTHIHTLSAELEELAAQPMEDSAQQLLWAEEPALSPEQRQLLQEQATVQEMSEHAYSEVKVAAEGTAWDGEPESTEWKEAIRARYQAGRLSQRDPFASDRQLPQQREYVVEGELGQLVLFNDTRLLPGQVVSFAEALPLREPGIEQHELGVVRSLHRGGITFDYATVELVGGRLAQVYQADPVQLAPPEITAESVLGQRPDAVQRDPRSRSVLPLANGNLIQRGDLVRFTAASEPQIEAGTEGRVLEVERHAGNRARVLLEQDGRQVTVLGGAPLEIVEQAPAEHFGPAEVPEPLPARDSAETAARGQAQRGNLDELLAHYQSRGRLEFAAQPGVRALELASQKPGSLVIAQDQVQRWQLKHVLDQREQKLIEARAEALHQEERQLPEQPADGQPRPDQAVHQLQQRPRLVTAEDAYWQRSQARQSWIAESTSDPKERARLQTHLEPEVPQRAIVVINDSRDAAALSRGLSGAAEAHLVTRPPAPAQRQQIEQRAAEMVAERLAEAQRAVERQAAETQRQLAQRSLQAEPEVSRSPERRGVEP